MAAVDMLDVNGSGGSTVTGCKGQQWKCWCLMRMVVLEVLDANGGSGNSAAGCEWPR